jgi:hypothetical protein
MLGPAQLPAANGRALELPACLPPHSPPLSPSGCVLQSHHLQQQQAQLQARLGKAAAFDQAAAGGRTMRRPQEGATIVSPLYMSQSAPTQE